MTTTRPTFADWIAANPTPAPVIPEGFQQCSRCDGAGTETFGYRDGQPIEDRCRWCQGFGIERAPECAVCNDRGECAVADSFGEHDGIEYCSCAAGKRLMSATPSGSLSDAAADIAF